MESLNSLEIAKLYFELSNKSDMENIENLFTDSTTYSSQTTGIYLGKGAILEMQRKFHKKFSSLEWKVISVREEKPGVILFEFNFEGRLLNSEIVKSSGIEYVIVHEGKIQHIEIRNV